MKDKLRVCVVGCTGMVGQYLCTILYDHPMFRITALAASEMSAGKAYGEACGERWKCPRPMPGGLRDMRIINALDIGAVKAAADVVFCAVNMEKSELMALEEAYARAELMVVSNNSAHRATPDVPMIIPEVNPSHSGVIAAQRRRLGTRRGFIAVKPNCSVQCYVPALEPLRDFGITKVSVVTFQAISGSGRTPEEWPEMRDNVIPFIPGEEEKSTLEPLKLWGRAEGDAIINAGAPVISAQCVRAPVSHGHMAAVSVSFRHPPTAEEVISIWENYRAPEICRGLPSSPERTLTYFREDNMPSTREARDLYGGMGISMGRLREDSIFDLKFICVSHNLIRGAAGGAVLTGELLRRQGYMDI